MHEQRAEDQATYTAVASRWADQVQAYRQSVALFREVGVLRARRRRNAAVAAANRVTPVQAPVRVTPPARPILQVLPPTDQLTTTTRCPLTRRQLEVVELIAAGMTNAQIARKLVLTPGTVANHIEHILRRLDVPNRAAAATWLARERPRLVARSPGTGPEVPDPS